MEEETPTEPSVSNPVSGTETLIPVKLQIGKKIFLILRKLFWNQEKQVEG